MHPTGSGLKKSAPRYKRGWNFERPSTVGNTVERDHADFHHSIAALARLGADAYTQRQIQLASTSPPGFGYLECTANMTELMKLTVGRNVKEQIESDLKLEVEAVVMYKRQSK